MSTRLRGQETTIRVTVDGELQEGSWFKVKDFNASPRQDLIEEDYLGEFASDLDMQHHGYDLAFSVDVQDRNVIDFLSKLVANEEARVRHPRITVTVTYAFRDGSVVAEAYYDVFLKVNEQSIGGRKEYVSASFEGKAKKRTVLDV